MAQPIRRRRTRADLVKMLEEQGKLLVVLAVGVDQARLSGCDLHKTPAGAELMKVAADVRKMAGLRT